MKLSSCWCLLVFILAGARGIGEEKPTPSDSFSLADRLSVTEVTVDADIDLGKGDDNPSSFWNARPLRPVILALQPDGGAKVGWTDRESKIHITPLDEGMQRKGPDVVIPTGRLRDLVAHDDGLAAIVYESGGMYLIRMRGDETVFRKRLISNWCRDIHMGSLAWNGDRYAAYFAVHRGGHEGDALKFVDAEGGSLPGGWNWGCSHSIDMRLSMVGDRFMPLALSDAYPGTGIYFNHNKKRVVYTWGDARGATGGRIGGMVALGDRMYVAYSSRRGRSYWSAALADFSQQSPYKQSIQRYVHEGKTDQLNVKISRYGESHLLMSWREKGSDQRRFQRYDSEGNPIGDPEYLPVLASPRADFQNTPGGDVLWAHSWGDDASRTLKIVRIRRRES